MRELKLQRQFQTKDEGGSNKPSWQVSTSVTNDGLSPLSKLIPVDRSDIDPDYKITYDNGWTNGINLNASTALNSNLEIPVLGKPSAITFGVNFDMYTSASANDYEDRPTGGIITGYGGVKFDEFSEPKILNSSKIGINKNSFYLQGAIGATVNNYTENVQDRFHLQQEFMRFFDYETLPIENSAKTNVSLAYKFTTDKFDNKGSGTKFSAYGSGNFGTNTNFAAGANFEIGKNLNALADRGLPTLTETTRAQYAVKPQDNKFAWRIGAEVWGSYTLSSHLLGTGKYVEDESYQGNYLETRTGEPVTNIYNFERDNDGYDRFQINASIYGEAQIPNTNGLSVFANLDFYTNPSVNIFQNGDQTEVTDVLTGEQSTVINHIYNSKTSIFDSTATIGVRFRPNASYGKNKNQSDINLEDYSAKKPKGKLIIDVKGGIGPLALTSDMSSEIRRIMEGNQDRTIKPIGVNKDGTRFFQGEQNGYVFINNELMEGLVPGETTKYFDKEGNIVDLPGFGNTGSMIFVPTEVGDIDKTIISEPFEVKNSHWKLKTQYIFPDEKGDNLGISFHAQLDATELLFKGFKPEVNFESALPYFVDKDNISLENPEDLNSTFASSSRGTGTVDDIFLENSRQVFGLTVDKIWDDIGLQTSLGGGVLQQKMSLRGTSDIEVENKLSPIIMVQAKYEGPAGVNANVALDSTLGKNIAGSFTAGLEKQIALININSAAKVKLFGGVDVTGSINMANKEEYRNLTEEYQITLSDEFGNDTPPNSLAQQSLILVDGIEPPKNQALDKFEMNNNLSAPTKNIRAMPYLRATVEIGGNNQKEEIGEDVFSEGLQGKQKSDFAKVVSKIEELQMADNNGNKIGVLDLAEDSSGKDDYQKLESLGLA